MAFWQRDQGNFFRLYLWKSHTTQP